MKVEVTEDSIKLIAENTFEQEALKRLRKQGVEQIYFEDDWDSKGPLILQKGKHPWDK